MKYFIGADLGTSSCKLLLRDEAGGILRTVTKAYPVSYPRAGWSEQNPEDWWDAFSAGVRELTDAIDPDAVCALAVAGQMHGLVILDEADRVIRPVILWNDGRTGDENAYLNTEIGEDQLAEWTANISFAGFTAPKLLWLKKHEPAHFARIRRIMLPKDYINYRLTGVHACDYSDASGMLLLDVEHRCWSEQMLSLCGVTVAQMPMLVESYAAIGTLLPEPAAALGLSAEVVVAGGAGDNAGAAIGTSTVGEGKCNISLGTSGTVFISSSIFRPSENHALHVFCHADGAYHLMGCILSAASCNGWFCDQILQEKDYAALQTEITPEMLGAGDVFFLPYLMGERCPANDTDASGVFLGLRPNVTRKEMLLAVLEGVCFAICDNLSLARGMGIDLQKSTVSGGGARSALWLTILANVLNMTLEVQETEEGPALGAAMLAEAAYLGSPARLFGAAPTVKAVYTPDPQLAARYAKKYRRYREIYPGMKALFKALKETE